MSSKAMSLKRRIKNYAKSNNIAAQVVLQNYMFERFLERLSVSDYSEKFVVKGGMLIAAALSSICKIDLNDDVSFEIKSVAPIRKDDVYGGYCVRLDAIYDTIVTPLSIDVSTGDIITPYAVKYEFGGIFDENVKITLQDCIDNAYRDMVRAKLYWQIEIPLNLELCRRISMRELNEDSFYKTLSEKYGELCLGSLYQKKSKENNDSKEEEEK